MKIALFLIVQFYELEGQSEANARTPQEEYMKTLKSKKNLSSNYYVNQQPSIEEHSEWKIHLQECFIPNLVIELDF